MFSGLNMVSVVAIHYVADPDLDAARSQKGLATAVGHTYGEYLRCSAHTNTAEDFFSTLKRRFTGINRHVSEAHLQNRAALRIDDAMRTALTARGAKGKSLTYHTDGLP